MRLSQRSVVLLMRIRSFSSAVNDLGSEIKNIKPLSAIPTPSMIQMIRGNLPGGKYYQKSLRDTMKLINEEYGEIVRLPGMLGMPEVVMTFNPENFEKAFRHEGIWPFRFGFGTLKHYRLKKRPEIYDEYEGLFTAQGEKWHRLRTIANPILMQPKVVKLYTPQVDEIAQEFIDLMKKLRNEKSEMPKDFSNYINAWSFESVAAIALEQRLNVLNEETVDPKAKEFIKLIREFFEQSVEYEGKLSIWQYYETKKFKKLMEVYDGITNLILYYIDKAVEDLNKTELKEGQEESILRKFLKVNKKAAIAMVSDFLIAGIDTTASVTIGTLYCLAKNPEKQEILRKEILSILPSKDTPLTHENMKNMPYLRACIKESLRLYPIVVGTSRKITKDIVISGYQVPANTLISMIPIFVQRQPEYFANPDDFIPERWLRRNTECPHSGEKTNPFSYFPFGMKTRSCVGKRLADLEMEVLISRILRNFKLEWHYEDLKIKYALVNIPDSELKFKVIDL